MEVQQENTTMEQMKKPEVKKVRGSHFPQIVQRQTYEVSTVDGDVIYVGHSHHVARLIAAALAPRVG